MIPALTKTEKTALAGVILGEISPTAILFIVLSRPKNTKELVALLGPFIPGDTLREKIAYAFTVTRPAFDSDARFREVAFGVLEKLRGVTDDEGEPVGNWMGEAAAQTPADDDVDLSAAKWHGPDGRGCAVTETISGLTFDGKAFRYRQSAGTAKWTPRTGEKSVNQYACFFVKRGGTWTGGKFDWSSETRNSRERTNIDGGYTGGIRPVAGEEVRFCLTDLNMKKRTNAPGVTWK